MACRILDPQPEIEPNYIFKPRLFLTHLNPYFPSILGRYCFTDFSIAVNEWPTDGIREIPFSKMVWVFSLSGRSKKIPLYFIFFNFTTMCLGVVDLFLAHYGHFQSEDACFLQFWKIFRYYLFKYGCSLISSSGVPGTSAVIHIS